MPKWPWIERKFNFDFPETKFPDHLERLRGTPVRLEEHTRGLARDILTRTDAGGWSILENVGHLLDLEHLPLTRVQEILTGERRLTAADMSNSKTHQANHNAGDIDLLLAIFRRERGMLLAQFEQLAEADWGKSALHPRLNQPMRIVDLAMFQAEHDDYHLARINELTRTYIA